MAVEVPVRCARTVSTSTVYLRSARKGVPCTDTSAFWTDPNIISALKRSPSNLSFHDHIQIDCAESIILTQFSPFNVRSTKELAQLQCVPPKAMVMQEHLASLHSLLFGGQSMTCQLTHRNPEACFSKCCCSFDSVTKNLYCMQARSQQSACRASSGRTAWCAAAPSASGFQVAPLMVAAPPVADLAAVATAAAAAAAVTAASAAAAWRSLTCA